MITGIAICPHPPLLFRELTGRTDVAAELRGECLRAVDLVIGTLPDRMVVVGGARESGAWDADRLPEVRGFGTTGPREPAGLPLSLGVGRRLLDSAGWTGPVETVGVSWDASATEVSGLAGKIARAQRAALLVLGDGSARRGQRAPGYLDHRAFDFDAAVGRALATGDSQALLDMDRDLARELMVSGRAAFQVMATVVRLQETSPKPTIFYEGDPFGVMYHVATWQLSVPGDQERLR